MAATPMRDDWFNHDTVQQLNDFANAKECPPAELLRATLIASGTGVFFYPLSVNAQGVMEATPLDAAMSWTLNIEALLGIDVDSLTLDDFFSRVHVDDQRALEQHLDTAIARGDSECDC